MLLIPGINSLVNRFEVRLSLGKLIALCRE